MFESVRHFIFPNFSATKEESMKHRKAKRHPAPIRQRTTACAARDAVLATTEVLAVILFHLPPQDLLVAAPRVSKHWQSTIAACPHLQRALFFLPSPSRPAGRPFCPTPNPLLAAPFRPFLSAGAPELSMEGLLRCGLPIADASDGRRRHRAFARAGASWRRMLVSQPPPRVVGCSLETPRWAYTAPPRRRVLELPDGLRMGQLWDAAYSAIWGDCAPERGRRWFASQIGGEKCEAGIGGRPVDALLEELAERPHWNSWDYELPLQRKRCVGSAWLFRCEEYEGLNWTSPGMVVDRLGWMTFPDEDAAGE
jgi:hypothetical protein